MNCTTILGGLSEVKEFWATIYMLRYLLLLAGLDAVSGFYTTTVIERCETFMLPRSGFSRWYHRAMLRSGGLLCTVLAAITGITCFVSEDSASTILLAAGILALNLIVIANIQMFITLLSRNISLGYLLCMLVQLLSLFWSEYLPLVGKLLLIGNWGMMVRSTLVDPVGIPIGPVIGLEVIILALFWMFGWRVIRRNRRGA